VAVSFHFGSRDSNSLIQQTVYYAARKLAANTPYDLGWRNPLYPHPAKPKAPAQPHNSNNKPPRHSLTHPIGQSFPNFIQCSTATAESMYKPYTPPTASPTQQK
jgi:hypothetical protein